MSITTFLYNELETSLTNEKLVALLTEAKKLEENPQYFLNLYAKLPAIIGHDNVTISEDFQLRCIEQANCWHPIQIKQFELARLWLLLNSAKDIDALYKRAEQLFNTGEVSELILLYRALPLFPEPAQWTLRAAEGLRSNMTSVFQAVAHHNIYPSQHLDDIAWNQLVIKSLFTESGLENITGLEERNNQALAFSLVDYIYERRSAGRTIDPWIWRCIVFCEEEKSINAINEAILYCNQNELSGLALSLMDAKHNIAKSILNNTPSLQALANTKSWSSLSSLANA